MENKNNCNNHRKSKIDDMRTIARISSFLLLASILCKYIFNFSGTIEYYEGDYVYLVFLNPILVLIGIYFIVSFSYIPCFEKCRNSRQLNVIELILLHIIVTVIVLCSGGDKSYFKFIYLFIIIRAAIEIGKKFSFNIAIVSSILILAIDLVFNNHSEINYFFENDLILSSLFIITAWFLGYYKDIEKEHIDYLENLANIDGLTGTYNHRYFYSYLTNENLWDKEIHSKIAMIFVDIDNFKTYNDVYGHQNGDVVLKKISSILLGNVTNKGMVSRYGGDEFSIILPDVDESGAIKIAKKINRDVSLMNMKDMDIKEKVTISIGVSSYPDKVENYKDLIKSADDALYKAKIFSKNRVETYSSILDDISKNLNEDHKEIIGSIKTLISIINARDRYTYGHVERVVQYSRLMAEHINLSDEDTKKLMEGAYLHDIGKINIDKDVLMKKMKLTTEEWEQLKSHPEQGVDIIKPVESLQYVIPIILHHHERYDGTGYPLGLKGKEIPYLARVLTVIDSFDAMTTARPYNTKKTFKEAVEELKRCKNTQFDPDIVDSFVEVIEDIKRK